MAGTTKKKGASTAERPHRVVCFSCDPDVKRIELKGLWNIVKHFRGKLNEEQRTKVQRALETKRPGQPIPAPVAVANDTGHEKGDSPFKAARRVSMSAVMRELGLDPEHPVCPACDGKGGTSVKVLDDRVLKCLHNTCGQRRFNNIGLVAKVAFGADDTDKTTESGKKALLDATRWIAERFGTPMPGQGKRSKTNPIPLPSEITLEGAPERSERPEVIVTVQEKQVADQAIAALAAKDTNLFARANRLVRVDVLDQLEEDDGYTRQAGTPVIAVLPVPSLRERLSEAISWVKVKRTKDASQLVPTHPPQFAVNAIHVRGWWKGIRELRGIVEAPCLRPDGSVLDTPGYDQATGLLYLPNDDYEPIPESPTYEDGKAACEYILTECVSDFPFEDPDLHRSSWLAALLTPSAQPAIAGPCPMFEFEGNVKGVGKGLLAQIIGMIYLGRSMPTQAHITNDDEIEKRITSILLAGDRVVLIDNVKGYFGGKHWEAVTTARDFWSGRILGKTETVTVPVGTIWYFTGNNVELSSDMPRRICHIRLRSEEEAPQSRQGFRRPKLLQWIKENRPRLVRCVLVALRAFFVAKPEVQVEPWGSFEEWTDVISKCLVWYGYADPAKTSQTLDDRAGEKSSTGELLLAWEQSFGTEAKTTREVIVSIEAEDRRLKRVSEILEEEPHKHQALRDALTKLCNTKDDRLPSTSVLGQRLRAIRDRVVDGRRVTSKEDKHAKVQRWQVETLVTRFAGDAGICGEVLNPTAIFICEKEDGVPNSPEKEERISIGPGSKSPPQIPASPASSSPDPAAGLVDLTYDSHGQKAGRQQAVLMTEKGPHGTIRFRLLQDGGRLGKYYVVGSEDEGSDWNFGVGYIIGLRANEHGGLSPEPPYYDLNLLV